MSIADILEQAKKLTPQERAELVEHLRAMPDVSPIAEDAQPEDHWGRSLNQLLDEIGPIEMKYPEIEDPVEWVKRLRSESRRRHLNNWGEGE